MKRDKRYNTTTNRMIWVDYDGGILIHEIDTQYEGEKVFTRSKHGPRLKLSSLDRRYVKRMKKRYGRPEDAN